MFLSLAVLGLVACGGGGDNGPNNDFVFDVSSACEEATSAFATNGATATFFRVEPTGELPSLESLQVVIESEGVVLVMEANMQGSTIAGTYDLSGASQDSAFVGVFSEDNVAGSIGGTLSIAEIEGENRYRVSYNQVRFEVVASQVCTEEPPTCLDGREDITDINDCPEENLFTAQSCEQELETCPQTAPGLTVDVTADTSDGIDA